MRADVRFGFHTSPADAHGPGGFDSLLIDAASELLTGQSACVELSGSTDIGVFPTKFDVPILLHAHTANSHTLLGAELAAVKSSVDLAETDPAGGIVHFISAADPGIAAIEIHIAFPAILRSRKRSGRPVFSIDADPVPITRETSPVAVSGGVEILGLPVESVPVSMDIGPATRTVRSFLVEPSAASSPIHRGRTAFVGNPS